MKSEAILNNYNASIRAYISELEYRGISPATIENYKKRLKLFGAFVGEASPPPVKIDNDFIRRFRNTLADQGRKPSTIKQYLVELSIFFKFVSDNMHKNGYLTEETGGAGVISPRQNDGRANWTSIFDNNLTPTSFLPRVRNNNNQPYEKILTAEDITKLWAYDNNQGVPKKLWARNYAIIILLLDGKFRNGEILDMKLSDVDFENQEVLVRKGKGGKRRYVSITDISISAIKLYLNSGARPEYCTEDDYLFGTTAEHKFGGSYSGVERWHKGTQPWLSQSVEKHVRGVTGKSGFRTHSLRHNGAILDLNTGVSMERIQAELGHSSIVTTEIYAGRLKAMHNMGDYQKAIEERDIQAQRNIERLQKQNPHK